MEIKRRKDHHVRNSALIGAGTGAALLGLPALAVTRMPVLGAIQGAKGAVLGGAAGAGIGLLTRRKKRQELSAKLDSIINFESLEGLHKIKEGYEPVTEHARDRVAESAVESIMKKLERNVKIRRLSVGVDDLVRFIADPRPRDLQGQFESQGEGGPNPNSMATVYKQPQQQKGIGAGKFAGAALAGGALGAVGAQAGKAGWQQASKIVKRLAAKRKSVLIH